MERFSGEDGITDAQGVPIPWPTVFDEFGSDKGNHGYADFYTHLEPPKRMLEIGVAKGGSMLAWHRLWPDCIVVGVDLVAPDVLWPLSVYVFQMHYRAFAAKAEPAAFDLIVDDASHVPAEQVEAYRLLARTMRPGGAYVVEDVADASIADELGGELLVTGPGYDDRLLIIRS